MSTKEFRDVFKRWQSNMKKKGVHHQAVSPHEDDWPRRLAITVRIRDENFIISRTIALSMPYTDQKSIFHACIIRDNRRTDCLMDRKGYVKALNILSSISFSVLQPPKSSARIMSRDILFIIELGEVFCPQRSRFQWKNPDPGLSHRLEYIWELFGRVIQERNSDIKLDDLIRTG
jgi:hypothetical protein